MYVGDRLRQARIDAGLNQSQLARKAGVTPSAISQIESGASKRPSSDNLLPLAKALGVTPEWLISGKGPKYALTPIQERIAFAMKAAHMLAFDLEDATDGVVSEDVINSWMDGSTEPTAEHLDIISGPLGRTTEWLSTGASTIIEPGGVDRRVVEGREPIGEYSTPSGLDRDELILLKKYRGLSPEKKKAAQTVVDALVEPDLKSGNS